MPQKQARIFIMKTRKAFANAAPAGHIILCSNSHIRTRWCHAKGMSWSRSELQLHSTQCTLKVLIDFCSVESEFLTLSFVCWNFWYFTRNYYGISDLGLTLPHFEFLGLYLDMVDQNWSFLQKNEDFDQIYQNTGSNTQS